MSDNNTALVIHDDNDREGGSSDGVVLDALPCEYYSVFVMSFFFILDMENFFAYKVCIIISTPTQKS